MKYCCDAIEQIMKEYAYPFYLPILFDSKTAVDRPSIKLLKGTKAGNISKRGGATLIMSYCPLCGTEYGD